MCTDQHLYNHLYHIAMLKVWSICMFMSCCARMYNVYMYCVYIYIIYYYYKYIVRKFPAVSLSVAMGTGCGMICTVTS